MIKTRQPRKQRKAKFTAPLHQRRKWLSAHLDEPLLLKYDRRGLPVVKGDTVKVIRGSFRGHVDKVAATDVKREYVEIEGVTMSKADGKKVGKPIHASNLLITKLNLTDSWRRQKLERRLSEEAKKEIEKEAEEQLREIEKQAEEKTKEEEKLTEETQIETKKQQLPEKTVPQKDEKIKPTQTRDRDTKPKKTQRPTKKKEAKNIKKQGVKKNE